MLVLKRILAGIGFSLKIATARDASEIPVASYYGDAVCTFMDVQCYPIPADFTFSCSKFDEEAISYD